MKTYPPDDMSNFNPNQRQPPAGLTREQIVHKIHVDTYNDLVEQGYEPEAWLKKELGV